MSKQNRNIVRRSVERVNIPPRFDVMNPTHRREALYEADPFGTAMAEIADALERADDNGDRVGAGIEWETLKQIHVLVNDLDPQLFAHRPHMFRD